MIKSLIQSMAVCPDMNKVYPKIDYGKGVYVYDQNGKKYLDASSGSSAVSNIGHGRTEIADVIHQQVSKISVLPTHAFNSDVVESYLDRLVSFAPAGFSKAWTVMSGTEAVESAVKLALQFHQLRGDFSRYKVISRWNTYHGNSVFMLDVGGMKIRRELYKQWLNNFPHISPAYNYRRPEELNEDQFVQSLLTEFETTIVEEGPESIAAFIAEPVIASAMGAVPPPANYFAGISKICKKYGILFITDEILTGFGRTGKNFGMDNYGVVPDIIAAGKGMSGGYFPLSAVIASSYVTQPFIDTKTPFLGGYTFACNPVGCAVGNKVMDILEREDVIGNAKRMGALFLEKLKALYEFEIVGDVRGEGLLCGVEIVQNQSTKEPFPVSMGISKMLGEKAIQKGVVLYPGRGSVDGLLGNHLQISPPLVINEEQLDEIVDVLKQCLKEVMSEIKKSTLSYETIES
ncbi:aspartate aminotransferase family protein [Flavobacterium sp. KACC 22758]|uniref:aminotransferase family protein n=1 Tax=Flavobacterium sp. KACC 22758 TaxID=3025667 RepID=UPI00236564DE|nr:aspartate aminotransferase family protein [Flavobacterium sp. KACC 22758]WDF58188.1 aspartate aminotransferase family protein [Flavobacterium sp. KACC 22758]